MAGFEERSVLGCRLVLCWYWLCRAADRHFIDLLNSAGNPVAFFVGIKKDGSISLG